MIQARALKLCRSSKTLSVCTITAETGELPLNIENKSWSSPNLKPAGNRREHHRQQQETRKQVCFPDGIKLIEPVRVL